MLAKLKREQKRKQRSFKFALYVARSIPPFSCASQFPPLLPPTSIYSLIVFYQTLTVLVLHVVFTYLFSGAALFQTCDAALVLKSCSPLLRQQPLGSATDAKQ